MSTEFLFPALKAPVENKEMKMVLIHLADVADHNGMAWPTLEWLAQRGVMHVRTVQRAIKGLKEHNYLRVEVRRTNGGQKKNVYYLNHSAICPHDTESHGTPENPINKGVKTVPHGTESHGSTEELENTEIPAIPDDTASPGEPHGRESKPYDSQSKPHGRESHYTLKDPIKDTKGDVIDFDWFLKTHPKAPKDVEKCRGLFNKLTSEHLQKVRDHLLWYKDSQVNIQFLKGPESYLWQREYMNPIPAQKNGYEPKQVIETQKYLAKIDANEESKSSPEFVSNLLNEHGIEVSNLEAS